MSGSQQLLLAGKASSYQISRSVRLRSSASAYLNRTFGTPTNNNKWTYSGWFKRGTLGANVALFGNWETTQGSNQVYFNTSDQLVFFQSNSSGTMVLNYVTTQVFRDPAAWYHIVISYDNTLATTALNIYVNSSSQITAFGTSANTATQNGNYSWNKSGLAHYLAVGKNTNNAAFGYADGYFAEVNFIDGQALTSTSFGATDAVTGVWNPKKYSGTYGTNGFYLNFSDPTSTTTIAYDYSGNSNNWTANNISVTAGTTYDSMVDSPTNYGIDTGVGGSVRGNYAVLNAVDAATAPSDGNLRLVSGNANYGVRSTIQLPSSGKWYAECIFGTTTNANVGLQFGFATASASLTNGPSTSGKYGIYADTSGYIFSNTTTLTSGLGVISSGTVLQIAYDGATGNAWVGKTNVWYNSSGGTTGDPATGANPTFTSLSSVFVYVQGINGTQNFNAGQTAFSYTAPTGFKALCTQNLPTPTISNGANHMAATIWTGNGASSVTVNNSVNSISFQPDFVWAKNRTTAVGHSLYDSIRGAGANTELNSASTNAEGAGNQDQYGYLSAFNSNGFTGVNGSSSPNYYFNESGSGFVGWQWKGGGTAASNTAGSITSSVSASTTAGFSVVTYTGTGANATVGHGLGAAPSMIIVKARSAADWYVGHTSIGWSNTGYLILNNTGASGQYGSVAVWQSTAPTSTIITLGTASGVNASAGTYVAYCFAAIAGYSAFGSYTGNGSTDGPFIFTNMRPRWLMFKRTDTTNNWIMYDTSRSTYNAAQNFLYPDLANTEGTGVYIDFVSNGFKLRDTNAIFNASGGTYIYAAFAENPFTLARAR